MPRNEYDVVVLGAGIAGAAAALAAARAGAIVCVVHDAPGASALFNGAWRGPCPSQLQHLLKQNGYELRACDAPLPHPHGDVVTAQFAAASHCTALQDDVLVCGVAGLGDFHAASLAMLWGARIGVQLQHTTLTLAATPRGGWAPASLAGAIERDASLITAPLRAAIDATRAKHVVLPAVLGANAHNETFARVHDAVGVGIGEALGVAPSLPGWRLRNALLQALRTAAVDVIEARASFDTQDKSRVDDVVINDVRVRARSFVLATGKFISGGIVADAQLREPLLGCPVWIDHLGERFHAPEPLILTHPEREAEQPLLSAGVHTDENARPLGETDDVMFENVFVAGSIRADWRSDTHGAGDCAQDGWNAGEKAVTA